MNAWTQDKPRSTGGKFKPAELHLKSMDWYCLLAISKSSKIFVRRDVVELDEWYSRSIGQDYNRIQHYRSIGRNEPVVWPSRSRFNTFNFRHYS
ncbi:hypothetical protein CEXT_460891 [Caerostris extrusa]|uniref:Uncharacterized protein n=1 Tax=Caerostris extrusa TaxID=172846 RepID=A0AAV4MUJ5_CAEEX|nr:hypothetical protein CEXT_460891 [Caerostris extrusa]